MGLHRIQGGAGVAEERVGQFLIGLPRAGPHIEPGLHVAPGEHFLLLEFGHRFELAGLGDEVFLLFEVDLKVVLL